jgi:hypothetical protein
LCDLSFNKEYNENVDAIAGERNCIFDMVGDVSSVLLEPGENKKMYLAFQSRLYYEQYMNEHDKTQREVPKQIIWN